MCQESCRVFLSTTGILTRWSGESNSDAGGLVLQRIYHMLIFVTTPCFFEWKTTPLPRYSRPYSHGGGQSEQYAYNGRPPPSCQIPICAQAQGTRGLGLKMFSVGEMSQVNAVMLVQVREKHDVLTTLNLRICVHDFPLFNPTWLSQKIVHSCPWMIAFISFDHLILWESSENCEV